MTTSRVLIGLDDIKKADNLSDNEKRKVSSLIKKMARQRQRPERQPAPEGSISIREAARKYNIVHSTISRWVSRGYIPVLLRDKNWVYVNECVLVEYINKYKQNSGKGKKTVMQSNN